LRHRLKWISIASALTLFGQLLVAPPVPIASAQTADDTAADKAPSDAPTPVAVDIAPPTDADREPVPAPVDLNSIRHPEIVEPAFTRGDSPQEVIGAEELRPVEGSGSIDVLAASDAEGSHFAVVYPDVVNEESADGKWRDIELAPTETQDGWLMEGAGFTTTLPAKLGPEMPVTLELRAGAIASVLEGIEPTAGVADGETVRYPNVLPSAELVYGPAPGGYAEELVLADPDAGLTFTWHLTTKELAIADPGTGVLELYDPAGELVATLATPVVYDSAEEAAETLAAHEVKELAPGEYAITYTIDAAWAAKATYPLIFDPGTTQPAPSDDAYVYSGSPGANYGSSTKLEVGPSYRTFIKFPTGWHNNNRIIYSAQIWLWNTSEPGNDPLDIHRVSGGWTDGGVTWNNQPAGVTPPTINSENFPESSWWQLGIGPLYQDYNDGTYGDNGVRLTSSSRKTFASSSYATTSKRPYLLISYNDPAGKPTIAWPEDAKTFTTASPTLKIEGMPGDQNGDDTLVRYVVTDTQGQWTGSAANNSGWIDEDSFTIPAGWLTDGTQYWWRVESRDVCTPPSGLCSLDDAKGQTHSPQATAERSFSVALKHNGTDERWAMWSQDIGNGMRLAVNESNGNVVLDAPLDEIQTPLGRLHLGLTYNSQADANGNDKGLGDGWNLHAGPTSSGNRLPVELVAETPAPWAGVKIRYGNGRTEHYPYRSGGANGPVRFAPVGAGAGVVTKNNAGGYTYRGADGDVFTFTSAGRLDQARPVFSKPKSAAAQNGFYAYGYSPQGELTSVTDPIGRQVQIAWTTQGSQKRPSTITFRNHTWTLEYQANTLWKVTTAEAETVRFMETETCDGVDLVDQIRNGEQEAGSDPGWQVSYFKEGANNFEVCRATELYPPQPVDGTQRWELDYGAGGAGFRGYTSLATHITDPRGVESSTPSNDYRTEVEFNWAGLPIWIKAPELAASNPDWVTTMVWDTHNNLVCQASPAANATAYARPVPQGQPHDSACSATNTGDTLATTYAYEVREPYRLTKVTQPSAADDTGLPRSSLTYFHDEGPTFEGLWAEKFEDPNLVGVPDDEGMWTSLNQSWASGGAPGGISPGDNWSVRLSGMLDVPDDGPSGKNYEFRVTADDGVTLAIGNQVLLDCFGHSAGEETNCGSSQDVTMVLFQGPRPITIELADRGGPAKLKVEWKQASEPNSAYVVIPATRLLPNLQLMTRTVKDPQGSMRRLETTYGFAGDVSKMTRLPSHRTVANMLQTSDPEYFHKRTEFEYDDFGRRTKTIKFADTGDTATWQRFYTDDPNGGSCLTRTLDPVGAEVLYECNASGDVTKTTVKISEEIVFGTGEVIQASENRVTDITFDAMGRVKRIDSPEQGVRTFDYDAAGRLISTSVLVEDNAAGTADDDYATTTYAYQDYPASGGPTMTETLPDPDLHPAGAGGDGPVTSATVTHVYDWVGNEVQRTDARAAIWTTGVDAQNRVISATTPDPDGAGSDQPLTTSTAYSVLPNTVTVTGPDGVPTVSTYDFLGRVSAEQTGNLLPTAYSYDENSRLIRTETGTAGTATSTWTAAVYDEFGRLESTTAPWRNGSTTSNAITTYSYDAQTGKRSKIDGPYADTGSQKDWVTFDRDASLRITDVTMTTSSTESYLTRVFYNDADERIRITSDLTPIGVSPAKTQKRDFAYSKAGLLETTKEWHSGNPTTIYTTTNLYNEAGWLTGVQDDRPFDLVFDYDKLGRETRRSRTGTPSDEIVTTYVRRTPGSNVDGDGTIATTSNAEGGQITYTHDLLGRMTALDAAGDVTAYDFDDATGQLASVSAPGGVTTSYDYYPAAHASAGLLQSLTDSLTGAATTYTYDALGRPLSRATAGDITVGRDYEPDSGRVDTQQVAKGGLTYSYIDLAYDEAGSVTQRIERLWASGTGDPTSATGKTGGTGTWDYAYDGAGRMISADGPWPVNWPPDAPGEQPSTSYSSREITYDYDGQGNRTSMSSNGITYTWTTDSQGWPTSFDNGTPTDSSDDTIYGYSAAGELVSITDQIGADTTFAYDAWGHTTSASVSGPGPGTVDYALDALGRTISSTEGGVTTDLAYVGDSEDIATETESGTTTTFAYSPGGLLASKAGSATTQMAIRDVHDDVVAQIGQGGSALSSQLWYSPYGEVLGLQSSTPGTLGYQGDLTDEDTGAVDMLTRQYLPELGRFTTRDVLFGRPRDPMSLNQFIYTTANPLTYVDPTGMKWQVPGGGGGGGSDGGDSTGDDVYSAIGPYEPDGDPIKIIVDPCNLYRESGIAEYFDDPGETHVVGTNCVRQVVRQQYEQTGSSTVCPSATSSGGIVIASGSCPGRSGVYVNFARGSDDDESAAPSLPPAGSGPPRRSWLQRLADRGRVALGRWDDVVKALADGKNRPNKVVASGEELEKLYRDLTFLGEKTKGRYPGRQVRLPDGTRVGIRDFSGSGGPTIDYDPPSGKGINIHVSPWPPI
jgi:RHS repeat-associated protein